MFEKEPVNFGCEIELVDFTHVDLSTKRDYRNFFGIAMKSDVDNS